MGLDGILIDRAFESLCLLHTTRLTGTSMKVALHICCGVCAAGVTERLFRQDHEIIGFFYNPNIHPAAEYERRLQAARTVADRLGFPLEIGEYEPREWFAETRGLEHEPEGGNRCEVCFRMRLAKTCRFMKDTGADAFATTLTVSPHKSAPLVNSMGAEVGGDTFLAENFKKKDGFKRAVELARQYRLYRQDYCGCIYSLKEKRDRTTSPST
jgi:predicted adenine nucleotide alpha hydrolase (AANH) superfamily ATPase